jgi:cytochrome oxidase Cu insertion factor (SCO1/SenC/PrrC family)
MKRIVWVFLLLLASAGAVAAAPAAEDKTGVKVGQKAPVFTLKDQSGKEQSLSALLHGGPVALVFFRSAAW